MNNRKVMLSVFLFTVVLLTGVWISRPSATQPVATREVVVFEDGFEDSTLKWATWTYNDEGVPEMVDWIQRSNDTAFHGDYSLAMTTGTVTHQIMVVERSVCLGPDVEVSMHGVMRLVDNNGWGFTWWTELWADEVEYIARIRYDLPSRRWTLHTEAEGWIPIKGLPALMIAPLNKTAGGGPVWNTFHLRYSFAVKRWTLIEVNGYTAEIPDVPDQYTCHPDGSWGIVCWGNSYATRTHASTIYFDDLQLIQHAEDG